MPSSYVAHTGIPTQPFFPLTLIYIYELQAIIGAFTSTNSGVALLKDSGVFESMERLTQAHGREYICRLFLVNLCAEASGYCRQWMQRVLWNRLTVPRLRSFLLGYIGAVVKSWYGREERIVQWVCRSVIELLPSPGLLQDMAIAILVEACSFHGYLSTIVSYGLDRFKQGQLMRHPKVRVLFTRLLRHEKGAQLLAEQGKSTWMHVSLVTHSRIIGWLDDALSSWSVQHLARFADRVDALVTSRVMESDVYLHAHEYTASFSRSRALLSTHRLLFSPTPIPMRLHRVEAPSEAKTNPNLEAADLTSLYTVPWCVDVWVISPGGQRFKLPMDAAVDATAFSDALQGCVDDTKHAQGG